ncbi:hypothetical protein [Georgenia alba]|uniref:Uncharacterized protein n=1 Tax=Georgenia alba TaxID=2233858 RepID=A0ABW2Q212_9MICO
MTSVPGPPDPRDRQPSGGWQHGEQPHAHRSDGAAYPPPQGSQPAGPGTGGPYGPPSSGRPPGAADPRYWAQGSSSRTSVVAKVILAVVLVSMVLTVLGVVAMMVMVTGIM